MQYCGGVYPRGKTWGWRFEANLPLYEDVGISLRVCLVLMGLGMGMMEVDFSAVGLMFILNERGNVMECLRLDDMRLGALARLGSIAFDTWVGSGENNRRNFDEWELDNHLISILSYIL